MANSKVWSLRPVDHDANACAQNDEGCFYIDVDKDSRFRGKAKSSRNSGTGSTDESILRKRVVRLACLKGGQYQRLPNPELRAEFMDKLRFKVAWKTQPTSNGGQLKASQFDDIGYEVGTLQKAMNMIKLDVTALVDIVGVCTSPVLELIVEEKVGNAWRDKQRIHFCMVWKKRGNRSHSRKPKHKSKAGRKPKHVEAAKPAPKPSARAEVELKKTKDADSAKAGARKSASKPVGRPKKTHVLPTKLGPRLISAKAAEFHQELIRSVRRGFQSYLDATANDPKKEAVAAMCVDTPPQVAPTAAAVAPPETPQPEPEESECEVDGEDELSESGSSASEAEEDVAQDSEPYSPLPVSPPLPAWDDAASKQEVPFIPPSFVPPSVTAPLWAATVGQMEEPTEFNADYFNPHSGFLPQQSPMLERQRSSVASPMFDPLVNDDVWQFSRSDAASAFVKQEVKVKQEPMDHPASFYPSAASSTYRATSDMEKCALLVATALARVKTEEMPDAPPLKGYEPLPALEPQPIRVQAVKRSRDVYSPQPQFPHMALHGFLPSPVPAGYFGPASDDVLPSESPSSRRQRSR